MTSFSPELSPPLSIPNTSPPRGRFEFWCAITSLVIAILSYSSIISYPLIDTDEFNYITASRQMVEQGDWITPHFNGEARVVKPILVYWIFAAAFKIFGVHIAVARLCSAAAAMSGVLVTGLTGRHLLGTRAGLLAAVFAAGHLTVLHLSHSASVDTTLWAFTALANYATIRILFPLENTTPPNWCGYLFFVATALAFLTKGPVALAWCFVPLLWPIFRRDIPAIKRFPWARGILIALILVVPWASFFLYYNWHQIHDMLFNPASHESYSQFASPVQSLKDMSRIFPQILVSILPWIPLIILALLTPRLPGFTQQIRCIGFLIFWLAALLIILTLAHNKSERYMLTPIAPTALLLAGWFDAALNSPKMRSGLSMVTLSYGIITAVLSIPIILVIFNSPHDDTRRLWAHVAVLLVCAEILLRHWRSPRLHQILPAIVVSVLYLNMFLLDWTTMPLTGATIASLAPEVESTLPPDKPILMAGGLSARYLVYMARRPEQEVRTPQQLLDALGTAQAIIIREKDWSQVPQSQRDLFTTAAQCMVPRDPPVISADLDDNREPGLLLVRKTPPATQPPN